VSLQFGLGLSFAALPRFPDLLATAGATYSAVLLICMDGLHFATVAASLRFARPTIGTNTVRRFGGIGAVRAAVQLELDELVDELRDPLALR
jgi:hypothetical protein